MVTDEKRENGRNRPFNPNEHVIEIKTKNGLADYLPVQWRLVWFRSECPDGTIETEALQVELDRETEEEGFAWNEEKRRSEKVIKRANGFALFHAVVKNGKGGVGTGTKSEKAASFPDFIEKAETGAIGRALAALGYGTQYVGEELDEGNRIADAPVGRDTTHETRQMNQQQTSNGKQDKSSTEAIAGYHRRVAALGLDYAAWKGLVLDKQVDDDKLDVPAIVKLGRDLEKRERAAKA